MGDTVKQEEAQIVSRPKEQFATAAAAWSDIEATTSLTSADVARFAHDATHWRFVLKPGVMAKVKKAAVTVWPYDMNNPLP